MASLLAQITTLALGAAASPLPIVAVLIMLITKRARPGSIVMATCWVLGNFVAIWIAIRFANSLRLPRQGVDAPWENVFALLVGVGLVTMALLSRRGRRHAASEEVPHWIDSVDNLSPAGGGLVAFLNATTSPKNLALAITAGKTITQTARTSTQIATAALYYVGIASLSVVIPVVIYFVGGRRADATLRRWRDVVTANAAAVMEIALLVLGIAMSVKGIYNLLS